jgi:hypothetical protein
MITIENRIRPGYKLKEYRVIFNGEEIRLEEKGRELCVLKGGGVSDLTRIAAVKWGIEGKEILVIVYGLGGEMKLIRLE